MSRGQILIIGGRKGGVGKTTLSALLAVEFAYMGANVRALDADPQESLSKFAQRRDELIKSNPDASYPQIFCVSSKGDIQSTLKQECKNYDIVIVDTAGSDSQSLRSGLVVADKFICPIRPSQLDIETLNYVWHAVNDAKVINPSLECYFLLSLTPTNPQLKEIQKARDALNEYCQHFKLLNNLISDLSGYRDAILEGKCIREVKDKKADRCKIEIEKLIEEVMSNEHTAIQSE